MWTSDGRDSENPEINYGTGGLLQGKQYILTTSWNAPQGGKNDESDHPITIQTDHL
jgi:putative NADPH-quinone reductase